MFNKHNSFKDFVVVPSDTTRQVVYEAVDLASKSPILCKRILGFNCHQEPANIVSGQVGVEFLDGKWFPMPDLTALICAFSSNFRNEYDLKEPERAKLDEVTPKQFLLKKEPSGVKVWELTEKVTVNKIDRWVPSTLDLVEQEALIAPERRASNRVVGTPT